MKLLPLIAPIGYWIVPGALILTVIGWELHIIWLLLKIGLTGGP